MTAIIPAAQAPPALRIWVDDPDGIPTRVEVRLCSLCAALVIDETIHSAFHRQVD